MFSTDDSIVAIATPPGRGGIGVVRISGPSALEIASAILERRAPLMARRATYTRVRERGAAPPSAGPDQPRGAAAIDEVLATYFPAPRSYTGDDVVEVSAHAAAQSFSARFSTPRSTQVHVSPSRESSRCARF